MSIESSVARARESISHLNRLRRRAKVIDLSELSQKKFPRVKAIKAAVAQHYNVSVEDIDGPRRYAAIVRPRHVATYLAYRLTPHSTLVLGRLFKKDHTCVINSKKKVETWIATDQDFASLLEDLKRQILGDQNNPQVGISPQ